MAETNIPDDDATVPWLNLTTERVAIPEKLAHELAGIVIEWGRFEMTIWADTSTMMAYPNVHALAKEAPRTFRQKIDLWKRCVHTLYPTVSLYRKWASEICSKGKVVAQQRNRLIHGLWDVSPSSDGSVFRLVTCRGLDRIEAHEDLGFDVKYVAALHTDIQAVTSALVSLITNRMWHAQLGSLKACHAPKP